MRLLTAQTNSTEETEACGAGLARRMRDDPSLPPFVALCGDLGTGKTAFVRGFVSVIAPHARVCSPTFSLVNEYPALPRPVFHFDVYRITGEDDLASIGFDDYLSRPGICLVEWSENIPYALPESYLRVCIEKDRPALPESRRITVEQIGDAML